MLKTKSLLELLEKDQMELDHGTLSGTIGNEITYLVIRLCYTISDYRLHTVIDYAQYQIMLHHPQGKGQLHHQVL